MKVILDQAEIFEAITDFVRKHWKLDDAASVSIGLTNARAPKGHSAEVDITYPKSHDTLQVTARDLDDTETAAPDAPAATAEPEPVPTTAADLSAATGVKVSDDLFGS